MKIKIRFQEFKKGYGKHGFYLVKEVKLKSIPDKFQKIHFDVNGVDTVFEIVDIHHAVEVGGVYVNMRKLGTDTEYTTKFLKTLE